MEAHLEEAAKESLTALPTIFHLEKRELKKVEGSLRAVKTSIFAVENIISHLHMSHFSEEMDNLAVHFHMVLEKIQSDTLKNLHILAEEESNLKKLKKAEIHHKWKIVHYDLEKEKELGRLSLKKLKELAEDFKELFALVKKAMEIHTGKETAYLESLLHVSKTYQEVFSQLAEKEAIVNPKP